MLYSVKASLNKPQIISKLTTLSVAQAKESNGKVCPLYEPRYVIHCVGNLTDEKSLCNYVRILPPPYECRKSIIESSNSNVMMT
jgi:hypothetical protein